jgi:hypothetical protein
MNAAEIELLLHILDQLNFSVNGTGRPATFCFSESVD